MSGAGGKWTLYHHEPTSLIITGAVDDLWVKPSNELIVVDPQRAEKPDVSEHVPVEDKKVPGNSKNSRNKIALE